MYKSKHFFSIQSIQITVKILNANPLARFRKHELALWKEWLPHPLSSPSSLASVFPKFQMSASAYQVLLFQWHTPAQCTTSSLNWTEPKRRLSRSSYEPLVNSRTSGFLVHQAEKLRSLLFPFPSLPTLSPTDLVNVVWWGRKSCGIRSASHLYQLWGLWIQVHYLISLSFSVLIY